MLVGITKVRNEALILADTLRHVLQIVDRVVLYDDASTDDTVKIAQTFDRVQVIRGQVWSLDREAEETHHRALVLEAACEMGATWALCFDADERIVGELPDLSRHDGYRFRLFDGYLTPDCRTPYTGGPLADLPRLWGPEYRDILMLFRVGAARFTGRDQRAPRVEGSIARASTTVKHFGKCLSVRHWEETCDYYATYWPKYRDKWAARRGKALHTHSDFGRPLYPWPEVIQHGVPM